MTYSIVARDPDTGQLGLAVQSHAFGVGRILHHVEPGVGAVATQASVLVAHGDRVLAALGRGAAPAEALADSLALDEGAAMRQVTAIDAAGRTAAHTGETCIPFAGHHRGHDWVVAGNILAGEQVLGAMVVTAEATNDLPLARRLLAVLEAAERAGGDLRGRQSATMVVAAEAATGDPLVDLLVDVRVDDHHDPLPELARLLGIAEAHHELERAEHLLLDGRADEAVGRYEVALARLDDADEFHLWAAIALVEAGRPDQAAALVAALHDRPDADRWQAFTGRLVDAGLLDARVAASWW